MTMLHLMKEAGLRIGVAHCNFQLRGGESLGDEEFVRGVCQQLNVPFLAKRFDTAAHASAHGISIQMAARDLRYGFFQELLQTNGYDYIATAHHYDDVIESVFLNLIRGTGIDGLRGIAPKNQDIIRPLLFATRQMIRDYAVEHTVSWREDASNATDDYQRNFIRHQIIPRIQELNANFGKSFGDTHERLLGAREFALEYIATFRKTAVDSPDSKTITIDIGKIRMSPAPAVLLWELIKELGFKFDQCKKVVEHHQAGKLFYSESYQLLVDRTHYIVEKKQFSGFPAWTIEKGQRVAGQSPFMLVMREVQRKDFSLQKDSALAQLDSDRLRFPLVWRKWQAGDYFIPLGMRDEKKVSDFLIDLKIPFNSKADITVLESAGEILWVVGHRISERYKVTTETKHVLVVEQVPTVD